MARFFCLIFIYGNKLKFNNHTTKIVSILTILLFFYLFDLY